MEDDERTTGDAEVKIQVLRMMEKVVLRLPKHQEELWELFENEEAFFHSFDIVHADTDSLMLVGKSTQAQRMLEHMAESASEETPFEPWKIKSSRPRDSFVRHWVNHLEAQVTYEWFWSSDYAPTPTVEWHPRMIREVRWRQTLDTLWSTMMSAIPNMMLARPAPPNTADRKHAVREVTRREKLCYVPAREKAQQVRARRPPRRGQAHGGWKKNF